MCSAPLLPVTDGKLGLDLSHGCDRDRAVELTVGAAHSLVPTPAPRPLPSQEALGVRVQRLSRPHWWSLHRELLVSPFSVSVSVSNWGLVPLSLLQLPFPVWF